MFKKTLILLTTTAILLPMQAVSASSDERGYRERSKQERVQRNRAPRKQDIQRHSRRAAKQQEIARQSSSQQRQIQRQLRQNIQRQSAQPSVATRGRQKEQAFRVQQQAKQQRPTNARFRVAAQSKADGRRKRAEAQAHKNNAQAIHAREKPARARDTAVRDRGNVRVRERARAAARNQARTSDDRRGARNTGRALSTRDVIVRERVQARNVDKVSRSIRDTRRAVRNSVQNSDTRRRVRDHDNRQRYGRGYDRGRHYNDTIRDRHEWNKRSVRDRYRGNYRQNWWYRNRWHRDRDIYFGFSPFYYGFGYSVGYINGHYNGYHNGHYYDRDYYFGHWPFRSGYYRSRASWGWNHSHHHYHYGDYCPHTSSATSVTYYDDHSYHSSSSGDQVAGLLLGGIVGGIIGAEIDGGRDKTAGAVIGSIVGATIGANATKSKNVDHYPETGVVYDAGGRHPYEEHGYVPPREVRTCMRYENKQGQYLCTKWSVEYIYDDEQE